MKEKVKVLIVDDSAIVRQVLSEILDDDPAIQVIGTAGDPFIAARKLQSEVPDVITLDVEMPRMDGITFLRKLMSQHPIPVVMCSSLTDQGCETTIRALEAGAVDVITKPRIDVKKYLEESRVRICDAVKAAAQARLRALPPPAPSVPKKLTADAVLARPARLNHLPTTDKVAVVGASTGGTVALQQLLEALPEDSPGLVIVQHMPEKFTRAFAARLNELCRIEVREAQSRDSVLRGLALIAPGNRHTLVKRQGARYYVDLDDGPLVSRHRPSVDVLFRSAARWVGPNAIGVIMTGMGDDGAQGMAEMKEAGAFTVAQDEATSVVFGMPNEAIKKGVVDKILPLQSIPSEITRFAV
ncbi:MAG: chemotaxis response regulator protein-glutamate methylesterase [Acidobacteriota bacterium]